MPTSYEDMARRRAMVFSMSTTYRSSFIGPPITPDVKPEYKDNRQSRPRPKYKPIKDTHAITDYKDDAYVPFTLFWDFDPIIKKPFKNLEDPREVIDDLEHEKAVKTRRRVLMPQAFDIDSIEPKEVRDRFLKDMYTSQMEYGLKMGYPVTFHVKSPYPGTDAPPRPITLPKWKPGLVSPEWRMDSVKGDSEQLRGYCDTTKKFWLNAPQYDCRACDEFKIVTDYRRNERQDKSKRPPFKP